MSTMLLLETDMRTSAFPIVLLTLASLPHGARAQETCEERRNSAAVSTVIGGGIGALLGSAVAGREDRAIGAVLGGIGGSLVGRQVTPRTDPDCATAYGYYDNANRWHATGVRRGAAKGYFDNRGAWVEGAPSGYYDERGAWIAANDLQDAAGSYDRRGNWAPAAATGYRDSSGRWIVGAASGYYNTRGRWVPGATSGHYDRNGRWLVSTGPADRSAGQWGDRQHLGFYDAEGVWRRGIVTGFYDAKGRWIATTAAGSPAYPEGEAWAMAPPPRADFAREAFLLESRIMRGQQTGELAPMDGERGLNALDRLRWEERGLPRYSGAVRAGDARRMDGKLIALDNSLNWIR